METLLINEACYDHYFSGVVDVSEKCKYDSIKQFIRERQHIDIYTLLGSTFYVDVLDNIDSESYKTLFEGGTYEDCNKNKKIHFGLLRVLTHYAYAAYIYRHSMKDTPFGVVIKSHNDSIPVPTSELRNLHDENRTIAHNYWLGVKEYLCSNKDTFSNYSCGDDKDCNVCSSNSHEKVSRNTRNSKIKILRKL